MRLEAIWPWVTAAVLVLADDDQSLSALSFGSGTDLDSTTWVTTVVPTFTTYCPSPTTWAYLNTTYTISSETTITLPCPCTVSISTAPPTMTTSTYTTEVPCTEETVAPGIPATGGGNPLHGPNITSLGTFPSGDFPPGTVLFTTSTGVMTVIGGRKPSTFLSGTTNLGGGGFPGFPSTTIGVGITAVPTHTAMTATITPGVVTINPACKLGPGAGTAVFLAGLAALAL